MPALVPVFNPAALGLTSGRVIGFNGITFTNTLATFASSGNLLSVTAGIATDIPLTVKGAASQSGNLFEVRNSADSIMLHVASDGKTKIRQPGGTVGTREMHLYDDGTESILEGKSAVKITGVGTLNLNASSRIIFSSEGTSRCDVNGGSSASFRSGANIAHTWSSANDNPNGTADTGLRRSSAGVFSMYDCEQTGNPGLTFQAKSTTTDRRDRLLIATSAVSNIDASRKYRAICSVYDTAAREAFRVEASGTAAMIGFLGAAAIVRPTVTGSRGGNAALASVLTELANLGLIVDSSTV